MCCVKVFFCPLGPRPSTLGWITLSEHMKRVPAVSCQAFYGPLPPSGLWINAWITWALYIRGQSRVFTCWWRWPPGDPPPTIHVQATIRFLWPQWMAFNLAGGSGTGLARSGSMWRPGPGRGVESLGRNGVPGTMQVRPRNFLLPDLGETGMLGQHLVRVCFYEVKGTALTQQSAFIDRPVFPRLS